jgi:hypothetical protein
VAGGFLVAAAAVGLFGSYLQATARPVVRYVVARRAVEVGHPLAAADVVVAEVDLPTSVAAHAFRNQTQVVGRIALAPVAPGQLVEDTGLAGRGDNLGGRQVAVVVDAAQVDGLQAGTWVDVLVTRGQGADSHTDVVASGARLLGLSRPHSSLGTTAAPVAQLDVADFDTVRALVEAAHDGSLTLVPTVPTLPSPGTSGS